MQIQHWIHRLLSGTPNMSDWHDGPGTLLWEFLIIRPQHCESPDSHTVICPKESCPRGGRRICRSKLSKLRHACGRPRSVGDSVRLRTKLQLVACERG